MNDDKDAWLDEVKQWVFGAQLPAHMRPASEAHAPKADQAAANAPLDTPPGNPVARAA